MSLVLVISIAIRLAALGWTLWLLRRIRDWRIGFMAVIIALMTLRQSLTLSAGVESESTELPGLAVSVMILVAVVFLGRLLTEHQRVEENLQESEGRFRILAEAAPIGIFLTKPTGECIYTNPAWTAISGLRSEESLGYGWMRVIHPDDREKVNQSWRAASALGGNYTTDYRVITPAGNVYWLHVLATPQHDASGSVVSYVGSVENITERKLAEEKLKTHYRELEALLEINQNILNSLDLQLIIEGILDKTLSLGSFDLGAIRLLDSSGKNLETAARQGYKDAKVGRSLRIDPITHDSGRTLIRVITEKETRVVENVPEFDGMRTFKKEDVQSAIVIPVLAQGQILGTIQLGSRKPRTFGREEIHFLEAIGSQMGLAVQKARLYQDVKNQAIELERANKVKDEFLSVMSHEIRTPLNTFVGYTEMVRDKMVGEINQKQEEVLGRALNQAGILLDMINRVLLTTQIDGGMVKAKADEVDLVELLDKLQSTYGVPMAKNVSLRWSCPSDLPRIRTDSDQLKHILENLINNALKFTHEGYVTISARHIPDSGIVEFQVADTGIGIRKESLSAIFGKFRQVDSSETRLYGGVGLGLYIAQQMTEGLGGTLEVESEFGKGSTFTLRIPIEL